jgi:hypothetical protein
MQPRLKILVAATTMLVIAVSITSCSAASPASTKSAGSASAAVDLSGVCPATVVVQTDWNPEAEHGALYEMLGANPVINADQKSVTGDLVSGGKSTGVKLEIRAGGPAIGFQSVSSQMYQDTDITMGYLSTDEAVQNSVKLPTTAVFAESDKSPQIVMWDPASYPKVKTIKQLGAALADNGHFVRYFGGAAYMAYLTGSGFLPAANVEGTFDGTPGNFVASKGKDAQQGFATEEPYTYPNEISAWGKPIAFQLIADTGYPIYPEPMAVRSGDLTKLTPCLKKLVPMMQQADVDYFAKPDTANKLILDLVTAYNNGWVYDAAEAKYAVSAMKKLGIVSNGTNGYVGDMDPARVDKVISIDTPIFTKTGSAPVAGLKASDITTNEFLDKTIGF